MRKSIRIKTLAILTLGLLVCAAMLLGESLTPNKTFAADVSQYHKKDIFESDGSITEIEEGYAFPDYCYTGTPVGSSDTGIKLMTATGNGYFTYKNPIMMRGKTSDDILFEGYPICDSDSPVCDTVTITLTDADDPDNTVSVRVLTETNEALYARVEYKGMSKAWGSETANKGRLFDSQYGVTVDGYCYFKNSRVQGKKDLDRPVSIAMDYAERQVWIYFNSSNRLKFMALDLDSVNDVGGNLWDGFTNDRAILSVGMTFRQAKLGGMVVKSIAGQNLDGSFTSEEDFPEPIVECDIPDQYKEAMPDGAVGIPYPVPEIYANDWFFGENQDVDVAIKKDDGNGNFSDVTGLSDDKSAFTATDTGSYKIVYTVSNGVKTTTQELPFNIQERRICP